MNGTYYEIVGGCSKDYIKKVEESEYDDKKAIHKAIDTERVAYKNTYKEGYRIESIKLYDPYDDEYFPVDNENLYYEPLPEDLAYKYSMLDRLKSDCNYFLGNGSGYEGHLWANTIEEHIKEMRNRWNELADDEKPEWLTLEQINRYEKDMLDVREQIKPIKSSMAPGSL